MHHKYTKIVPKRACSRHFYSIAGYDRIRVTENMSGLKLITTLFPGHPGQFPVKMN